MGPGDRELGIGGARALGAGNRWGQETGGWE